MTQFKDYAGDVVAVVPHIAGTVVYRHPCDCEHASRPLAEGELPEHRFDVEGEPFPWAMQEGNPSFTRLTDNLWSIAVTMFPMLSRTHQLVTVEVDEQYDGLARLVVGGEVFPWAISDDGFAIRCARNGPTTVRVAFLVRKVDTDAVVIDARQNEPANPRTVPHVLTPPHPAESASADVGGAM